MAPRPGLGISRTARRAMKLTRLTVGEISVAESDLIHISRLPDGTTRWTGMLIQESGILRTRSAGRRRSLEQAEAEAVKWAKRNGAAQLVIAVECAG
jgi:hypothetical protein